MAVHVDIITPERLAFSASVDYMVAPGYDGEIGILANHAPLLAQLGVGQLRLYTGNEVRYLAISGGFLEVQKGSRVEVFAETAEMAEEIDAERARLAVERAKIQLHQAEDADLALAEAALNRALLRLKVAGRLTRASQPRPGNR